MRGITSCLLSDATVKKIVKDGFILCSIEPINAIDIRNYTLEKGNDKVILLPGTRLRVKSNKSSDKQGESVVYFEGISPVDDSENNDTEMLQESPSDDKKNTHNIF